jgi:hypothetical protein
MCSLAANKQGRKCTFAPGRKAGRKNPRRFSKRRGIFCALDRIRTYDLLLRRQTLYPLSYEGNPGFLLLPAGRPRA